MYLYMYNTYLEPGYFDGRMGGNFAVACGRQGDDRERERVNG